MAAERRACVVPKGGPSGDMGGGVEVSAIQEM